MKRHFVDNLKIKTPMPGNVGQCKTVPITEDLEDDLVLEVSSELDRWGGDEKVKLEILIKLLDRVDTRAPDVQEGR